MSALQRVDEDRRALVENRGRRTSRLMAALAAYFIHIAASIASLAGLACRAEEPRLDAGSLLVIAR